jgi:Xaa-Pro aminopeptidase
MNGRVESLRARLEEPLLVTAVANVAYLTGFHSSNAAVLVEPDRVRLFSDFRYAGAGRAVPDVEFVEVSRSLFQGLSELLTGRIGFEAEAVTYAGYDTLRGGNVDLVPRWGLVEELRAVKDESELDAIRRAAEITSRMYERLADERFVGRTEAELAWRVVELFHELGAEEPAFPTIVAAGANGARPHTEPGGGRIEAGQTVVVDAGAKFGDYCSDCTRTFATGSLPEELKRAYTTCLEAQRAALDAVRGGANAREVDGVARSRIEASGYGDAFGHGLGHGVGLLVHEAPRMAPTAPEDEVLRPGNVVTVEPGIYLEGLGGVRIEDLVVVTEDGPEVLTTFPKDLVSVE